MDPKRVVRRWKKASLETQWVSGGGRKEMLDQIWELYKTSYQKIGMHLSGPAGLFEYDHWEVTQDDSKPVAFSLYKATSFGLKLGVLGSDGTSTGLGALMDNVLENLKKPGYYGEVSHAIEKLTRKSPTVCAIHASKVLGKPVIPQADGIHYERKIEGLGNVVKKLVGNPRGIPSGPSNACPIPDAPLVPDETKNASEKKAKEKLAQELDLAEHAACQIEFPE